MFFCLFPPRLSICLETFPQGTSILTVAGNWGEIHKHLPSLILLSFHWWTFSLFLNSCSHKQCCRKDLNPCYLGYMWTYFFRADSKKENCSIEEGVCFFIWMDAVKSHSTPKSKGPNSLSSPQQLTICMLHNACVLSHFSCVRLLVTPWTVAHQVPLSLGILQSRILEWVALPSSRGSPRSRDWTCVSYVSWIGRRVLYLPSPPGKPALCIDVVSFLGSCSPSASSFYGLLGSPRDLGHTLSSCSLSPNCVKGQEVLSENIKQDLLLAQWLRLSTFIAGDMGLILGTKILHAAWCDRRTKPNQKNPESR